MQIFHIIQMILFDYMMLVLLMVQMFQSVRDT